MLVTILVFLNAGGTSVRVFTFMVLLATSACLVMYLVCCLALPEAAVGGPSRGGQARHRGPRGRRRDRGRLLLWAIAGAGTEASLWGVVLFAAGGPVYG